MLYNVGSVSLKVGSARVVGSQSVDFVTNIDAGDLFKLTSEAVFYDVASIQSATVIILSSRYANSSYNVNATGESIGTITDATKAYSGTLDYNPVLQNNVTFIVNGLARLTDNGGGVLTGTDLAGTHTGTIDYDTGAWTISLAATYGADKALDASYLYGNSLNSMSYQIVTDFTPQFSFPELSLNDVNFQHIFTKAVRMIESAVYNLSASSVTALHNVSASILNASHDVNVLATPYGFVTRSDDGNAWRIRVTNTGTVIATSV